MNLEKFLFKKISVWIYILTLVLGLIFLSLFGSVVRHVAKGGMMTGKIGFIAESIAKYPGKIIVLLSGYDLDPQPQIFDTDETFTLETNNDEIFNDTEDGFLLVSTYDKDGSIVKLFDLKKKKTIFSWTPPINKIRKLTPNYNDGVNVKKFYRAQHPILFKNGDLAFHSGGGPLVRIDKCNNVVWVTDEFYHHSNVLFENSIYSTMTIDFYNPSVYLKDAISIIDPTNGKIKKNIEINWILKKYLKDNFSLIYGIGEFERDLFHLNAIYPINKTDDFFQKGDLVISLRNLSTIFVYRESINEIVWLKTGPWINNHDAQYLGNGLFSIFSNNNVRGLEPKDFDNLEHSEVYFYDFKNDVYEKPYSKHLKNIKMRSSGLVQVLDIEGRDSVIQLNKYGKIIRINPDSKIWTYQNYLGDNKSGNINWSRYLSKNNVDLSFLKNIKCD